MLENCANLGFSGNRCQDKVRSTRDLFGEISVKDKGKREREWVRKAFRPQRRSDTYEEREERR